MAMMKAIALELEEADTALLQGILRGADYPDWLLSQFKDNELVRQYIQEELDRRSLDDSPEADW